MNEISSTVETLQPVQKLAVSGGFYQRAVMRALRKMRNGHLRIDLPDGEQLHFGQRNEPLTAKLVVSDAHFFKRCVLFGDIGFGEAYVAGEWETDDIASVITWFIRNRDQSPSQSGSRAKSAAINLLSVLNRIQHLLRPNSIQNSRENIAEHYDLGNKFYEIFLDPSMTYSSALFTSEEQSLEVAQAAKYEALCEKLKLQPTDRVLEIGCGWGGFSCYAAKKFGCRITAITISEAQTRYARERVQREGVSDLVEIRLQDYRAVRGQFDKIVSIEMLEAVGDRYLEIYFAKCHELLAPEGLLGVQMITCPDSRHAGLRRSVDWIQKHIFPGSLLLSIGRVNEAINRTGDLFLHDLHDFGISYEKTLRLWAEAFNRQLEEVRQLGFDERFIRKWNYYLRYCEAAFATRNISVVQAVYTRPNNERF